MIGSFNLDGKQIPLLCICLFFPFSFGLRSLPCILQDKAGSTSLTETTHTGVQIRVGLFICFIFNSQKSGGAARAGPKSWEGAYAFILIRNVAQDTIPLSTKVL